MATGTLADSPTSWMVAKSNAEGLRGYLATIGSPFENALLVSAFLSVNPRQAFWLGLTDQASEGVHLDHRRAAGTHDSASRAYDRVVHRLQPRLAARSTQVAPQAVAQRREF